MMVFRYSKLTDAQVLAKLLDVCEKEKVEYTEDGMEAVIFTAQGDMRQGLNNLQSTHEGFGLVKAENVFKVCDEPHPLISLVLELEFQIQFHELIPNSRN